MSKAGIVRMAQDVEDILLTCIPDIPEGMKKTPERYAKALAELTSGYDHDCGGHLFETQFEDDVIERYNQMVIVKDIPMFSLCEHHLLPFHGTVSIGYIPNGKVAGLSKLARLVEIYSRRFQVQERLTEQIIQEIDNHLQPKGAIVVIEAVHTCMVMRGIKSIGATTVTSAVRGALLESPAARAEFFSLIRRT